MSVHSHASGRQSTHSQAPDPVIELMNKMFDKVAGDAAAQRADVAAQRADADRREQQMQARMDAEITRREREAAEKACLQIELAHLKKNIAAEKKQAAVQSFSPPPATAQSDMHADSVAPATTGAPQPAPGDTHALMISADSHTQPLPPPTADSVSPFTAGPLFQPTAATRDAHSLALSVPAPADIQHAAPLPMTDYALPPVMPDMTVATGPPRVPPRTSALLPYSSLYTVDRALPMAYDVDIDRALFTVGKSAFNDGWSMRFICAFVYCTVCHVCYAHRGAHF